MAGPSYADYVAFFSERVLTAEMEQCEDWGYGSGLGRGIAAGFEEEWGIAWGFEATTVGLKEFATDSMQMGRLEKLNKLVGELLTVIFFENLFKEEEKRSKNNSKAIEQIQFFLITPGRRRNFEGLNKATQAQDKTRKTNFTLVLKIYQWKPSNDSSQI